jgi:nitroreductase
MDISTAIEQRRAVKVFDPEHRMTDAEIERLMSLTALAPTAFNIQHWRFVAVTDPELRGQLRAVSWDQAQVTDASLLVILCGDTKAWQKAPERYWDQVDEATQKTLVGMIGQYYEGREQVQHDEAIRSCGIAAGTLMLAAQELGYDTCPMDGFDFDKVAELINLPADHVITMFVAVGKAQKQPHPRGGRLPLDEVVITDRF